MPLPLAATLPTIAAFIGRSGLAAAIKRYGRNAALAAGKTKDLSSKGELGPAGHLSASKPPKVRGTKTQSGTEMPPTKINVDAAKAARRAANEAAQMGRGKTKIAKGLTTGIGAAVVGDTVGQAVGLGAKANDKRKNDAEVERLRRVGQRGAFRQAGERTAKAKAAAKVEAAKAEADAKAKAGTNAKFASARKTITDAVVARPKGPKTNPTGARTIAASRKAKGTTFTGRDKKQKANVTREELAASGLSLRDYLNKQQGKTRRAEMNKGGAVKKTTKKTNKVRGSGIAVRGVRPAKMR